jgi:hypothetical protein
MRLGGPHSRSGHCEEEKNILTPPVIEPWPSSPSLSRFDKGHNGCLFWESYEMYCVGKNAGFSIWWDRFEGLGNVRVIMSVIMIGVRWPWSVRGVTDIISARSETTRALLSVPFSSLCTGCRGSSASIVTDRCSPQPTKSHCQWLNMAVSLWAKRPGREADHSHPSIAELVSRVDGRDWSRGNVRFGWYSVRFLVGTPALLAGVFSDFTQTLQENAAILPQLGYGRLLQKSFPDRPSIRRSERRQVTLRFFESFILRGQVIRVTDRGGA